MGCLSEGRTERADEVRLGHESDTGKGRGVQGLRVRAVDRVPGAEHPSVQLFYGASHRTIFAHRPAAAASGTCRFRHELIKKHLCRSRI